MKKVVVIGANCAWQKVLTFENFRENSINRAKEIYRFSSGKGINFARAAKNYGKVAPCVVQFVGGTTGDEILKDLKAEKIDNFSVQVAGDTRVCTTCLDLETLHTTEIIEPSPSATQDDIEKFENICRDLLQSSDVAGVAICGTLIQKVSTELYLKIAEMAIDCGKILLLDSYKNMEKVFELRSSLTFLKINRDELFELTKIGDVKLSMEKLVAQYGFGGVMITDGPEKSYLATIDGKFYEFELSKLDKLINPIGSGDTASAVLLSEYLSSGDLVKSAVMAIAAASANCRSIKCGEFDLNFAQNYAEKIKIYEQ